MSQNFFIVAATEKLKDTLGKFLANFDALRSGFEGASYPPTPVKGQRAFVSGTWYTYDGTAWRTEQEMHNHNASYYAKSETDAKLSTKSDTSHNHNASYYTKAEVDSITSEPSGIIMMFGGVTPPTGWLLCNGDAISRATYAKLFAAIGTRFGTGDGSTTFNLPRMADRLPIGAGSIVALGESGGVQTHTHSVTSNVSVNAHTVTQPEFVTPEHYHANNNLTGATSQDGYHQHTMRSVIDGYAAGGGTGFWTMGDIISSWSGVHGHTVAINGGFVGNTNGANGNTSITCSRTKNAAVADHVVANNSVTTAAGSNIPPSVGVNFIIKI